MSPAGRPRTFFEHTGSRHVYKVKGTDTYVVAAEVKTIGDTKLPDHPVRILDPDTGKAVVEGVKTDKEGVVRVQVPEKKDYRIEIVDVPLKIDEPPPPVPHPTPAILVCEFEDETGKPIAHEPVELHSGDTGGGTAETDEHGRLHAPSDLGPVKLKLRDQEMVAHALPIADSEDAANLYRFVVPKKKT